MSSIIIVGFIIMSIAFFFIQRENHEEKIIKEINSMGGRILSIERRDLLTGPFVFRAKGTTVYRVEYEKENETKEGWVKFGGLTGTDWRL